MHKKSALKLQKILTTFFENDILNLEMKAFVCCANILSFCYKLFLRLESNKRIRLGKVRETMKKKIMAVALVVTMAASVFTGCGAKAKTAKVTKVSGFEPGVEIDTKNKIELTVWESNGGPDEFIEQAGASFTALYPNITIKYVNVESADAQTKIALDGPSGNGPDLFAAAHNIMGALVAGGYVSEVPAELTDTVKGYVKESCAQGATLTDSKTGDQTMYGYPVSAETYALFYNKKLIKEEEVPKTMDDLLAYIEEYKKSHNADESRPFVMDAGNAYYSVMFTNTDENHLYGETGSDITNTYMNTDAAVKNLQTFVKLSKAVDMPSDDLATKYCDAMFKEDQAAMTITGAWNIKPFEDEDVDFGITTIPSLPGVDHPPITFQGVRCMYVSSFSKHKNEAAAFAAFLETPEMQKLRYDITGTIPAADIEVDDEKGYMAGMNAQLEYSYPMPNMAQASLFWSAFGSAYSNIWNGNTKSDDASILAELDAANQTATKK